MKNLIHYIYMRAWFWTEVWKVRFYNSKLYDIYPRLRYKLAIWMIKTGTRIQDGKQHAKCYDIVPVECKNYTEVFPKPTFRDGDTRKRAIEAFENNRRITNE